jgi:opacity protein-like surface antigen
LFALGGVGYYTFEAEQSIGNGYNMSITKNETAPRIGLGVQYDISEKISLRGVLKHAFINSDDVDSITELTVGIRYNF